MAHLTQDYLNGIVRDIAGLTQALASCENSIRETSSYHDRKINDLLHTIELDPSKSACDGYLLYKELKEHLETRRAAKDAWDYLGYCRKINKLHSRKNKRIYTPRADDA